MSRTTDAAEYYVAGRRVPAVYNGMATGADWMSAASFIGMAGTLYLTGYGGLAFIMGWTGGYCLVALFLAPYLRKFGQFTIPDFLGARYEGNLPRFIGIVAAILCSFTYVVAQIYGVGLITTRLTGLAFEIGIFVGLGGILVCSFLGGMRAVTWTQVAQYIILIIAYLVPVVWLSVKQTSVPVPQVIYGYKLEKVTAHGKTADRTTRRSWRSSRIFKDRAAALDAKLKDLPAALAADQAAAEKKLADLKAANAPGGRDPGGREGAGRLAEGRRRRQEGLDRGQDGRRRARPSRWPACRRTRRSSPAIPTATRRRKKAFDVSRRNFLALIFCLMVGTAALPHILMRYYTTPSVKEARDVGDLVAVLHLPAVLHGAGPGGAGQVRGVQRAGGHAVRQAAGLDRQLGSGRSDAAVGGRHQQGRHLPARRDAASAATSSCWPRRRSAACRTWSRAWWPPAAWRRRCRPPTACC